METLEIRTKLFSAEPEGDSAFCNGKPGSQLAQWIRQRLHEQGYICANLLQEDYGWGFHIKQQDLNIWVAVGIMDEQIDDYTLWGISVEHEATVNILQWFKKRETIAATDKILSLIKAAIASEPNIL